MAGTGKTIVALHRAVFLARANPDARVLLTTFSDVLANGLRTKLRRLIGNEPRLGERLDVYSLDLSDNVSTNLTLVSRASYRAIGFVSCSKKRLGKSVAINSV